MAQTLLEYFQQPEVMQKFTEVIGDVAPAYVFALVNYCEKEKAKRLIKADRQSIESAFLMAASLNLNFDKSINECYIIAVTSGNRFYATFNLTWRGLYQLCTRSDKYATVEVDKVVEGELKHQDRQTGKKEFEWVQDNDQRNGMKVTGYNAYFETIAGLSKSLYMSVLELEAHGKKYSDNYAEKWEGPGSDKFDGMARKTVLKLLLDKFGPKSSEMNKAIKYDQAKIGDGGQPEYIDNKKVVVVTPEDLHSEIFLLFAELDEQNKIPSKFYKRWEMIINEKEIDSYNKVKTQLLEIKSKIKPKN